MDEYDDNQNVIKSTTTFEDGRVSSYDYVRDIRGYIIEAVLTFSDGRLAVTVFGRDEDGNITNTPTARFCSGNSKEIEYYI